MARKIELSSKEREEILKKKQTQRETLFGQEKSKFNMTKDDLSEAQEPLSSVTDIINRFRRAGNQLPISSDSVNSHVTTSPVTTDYNNDTSTINVPGNIIDISNVAKHSDSLNNSHTANNNVPSTYNDTSHISVSSINNVSTDNNVTTVPLTKMQPVSFNPGINSATSHPNAITNPSFYPEPSPEETAERFFDTNPDKSYYPNVTTTKNVASNLTATSISLDTTDDLLNNNIKMGIISSVFTHETDLTSVERTFLVCLTIEMKQVSERISLNKIISKYGMRKATVYQIITHLTNIGIINFIADNNPKGSVFDLSPILGKYSLSSNNSATGTNNDIVSKKENISLNLTDLQTTTANKTATSLDTVKRMLLRNTALSLFKNLMLIAAFREIEVYNDKSIRVLTEYLLENLHLAPEENLVNLLGMAYYCSEKSKQPEKIIYYFNASIQKGGLETLQIAYKQRARELLDFSGEFFSMELEEPSLKEIKAFSRMLGMDENNDRSTLVKNLERERIAISKNIDYISEVINRIPELAR